MPSLGFQGISLYVAVLRAFRQPATTAQDLYPATAISSHIQSCGSYARPNPSLADYNLTVAIQVCPHMTPISTEGYIIIYSLRRTAAPQERDDHTGEELLNIAVGETTQLQA
jgi:hypothetical protein